MLSIQSKRDFLCSKQLKFVNELSYRLQILSKKIMNQCKTGYVTKINSIDQIIV